MSLSKYLRAYGGGPEHLCRHGDVGRPCLVLFFEAVEVTWAVECHHRLHCGPVKQLQELGADAERLKPLREVQPLVALLREGQGVQGPVQLAVDYGEKAKTRLHIY